MCVQNADSQRSIKSMLLWASFLRALDFIPQTIDLLPVSCRFIMRIQPKKLGILNRQSTNLNQMEEKKKRLQSKKVKALKLLWKNLNLQKRNQKPDKELL